MCTPTQGVWQPAGCVSCELVCVCVSFVRVVIICPASTHTALVSSPSLTVVHLSTYIQVGLDAAVSAGGRGRTPALSARQRRRKFWAIFLYSRHFQLTLPVLSNRIRISNFYLKFYLLLEVPSGPPPRSLDSGHDSPASGALLLGDGEKRQR